MYNTREELMNTLSYVDFSKLCKLIKYFPELNQSFVKEDINFPLSSSSIAIEWQKKHVNES